MRGGGGVKLLFFCVAYFLNDPKFFSLPEYFYNSMYRYKHYHRLDINTGNANMYQIKKSC